MKKKKKRITIPTVTAAAVAMTLSTIGGEYLSPLAVNKAQAAGFTGGDGTKENPYLISDANQLQMLNSYLGKNYAQTYFKLINDIDLTGINWTPIGSSSSSFHGHFDGNDYTINNLKIVYSGTYAQGLFGNFGGTIKNVTMNNADVSSRGDGAGILVGSYISNYTLSGAVFENIFIKNSKVSGKQKVGLLAGSASTSVTNGKLYGKNISVQGKVETQTSVGSHLGGLVGSVSGLYWKNIFVDAVIDPVPLKNRVGGLFGTVLNGSAPILIEDIFVKAQVTGKGEVGGVIGAGNPKLDRVIAQGTVDSREINVANSGAGGLVGKADSDFAASNIYLLQDKIIGEDTSKLGIVYGTSSAKPANFVNITAKESSYTLGNKDNIHEWFTNPKKSSFEEKGFDFENVWGILPQYNDGIPFLLFDVSEEIKQEYYDYINSNQDQDYQNALQLVEDAETSFQTGDMVQTKSDKDNAQRLVDQLSDEDARKQALQDRLDALQTKIDEAVQGEGNNQAARDAVEKAERDQTQSSIDEARKLVDALPEGELRAELTDRLDKVQAELDAQNAEKEKFEQLKGQIQAIQDGVKNGTISSDEYENTRKQLETLRDEVGTLTSPSNQKELNDLIDATLKLMDEQAQQLTEGPKNLQVVADSPNQVTISYDAVPQATEYIIKRNGVIIAYTPETTFVDTNVLHNQTYQYEVVARNAHSTSQPSKASVSTPIQYHDVTLSWPPSKDVVGYKIYRDNELIGETEETTYTDTKAVEGQNYKYRIEAIDADGEVMALSTSFEVLVEDDQTIDIELTDKDKPAVPIVTNVKAFVDNKNVDITWDQFDEAKRYRVQPYVLDPLTGEFVKDGFARSTTTNSLTLNTLKVGHTYKFEVVPATNKFLEDSAGFSNEVSLVESKPETPAEDNTTSESLTVKVEGTTAHLSWGSMTDVSRYRVQLYQKDETGQYVKSGAARAIAETVYSFTGLKDGQEYKFVIEPRVGFVYDAEKALKGFAKISQEPETTEPPKEEGSNPSVIKNVQVEMKGKTASLSWDALTVNGTEVTTYRIVRYVKDDVTGNFKSDGLSRTVSSTSYTDTYKLVLDKTYRYEITPRVGNRYATELTTMTDEYVNE